MICQYSVQLSINSVKINFFSFSFILVVHKGLAELLDVELPKIERLINWCQEVMGKEYLIANQVKGQNIGETRAPQRFGYHEIHAFVQDMGYI